MRIAVRRQRWAEQLDFAGPRGRTSVWGWAILILAVTLMIAVADEAHDLRLAHDEAQAQIKRLQRADRQLRLARALAARGPSAKAPPAPSAPALDAAAAQELNTMMGLLAHPWDSMLATVEGAAARQGAVLMALSANPGGAADGASAAVRLQAAVRDDAAALAWATAMPAGQLLGREVLTQAFSTGQGRYALKAQAEAWAGEQPKAMP